MEKEIEYDDAFLAECLDKAFGKPDSYTVPMGIERRDLYGSHGWSVRVSRDNVRFQPFFSDKKYGTIEAALEAALKERHQILSSFPVTLTKISGKSLQPEPESRVKIRRFKYGKNKDKTFESYIAKWYDEDFKIKSETFAFGKHGGKEEAWKLAVEAARKNHNYKPKQLIVPDPYKKRVFTEYDKEEVQVFSKIDDKRPRYYKTRKSSHEAELEYDPFGFEGNKKLVLHRQIERDRNLRKLKLQDFIETHGFLHCELCNFRFSSTYPFLETDIIEVHHIIPLSKLKKEQKTQLSDLMLLCSNCHFAIHQGDEEQNLKDAKEHFQHLNGANKSE